MGCLLSFVLEEKYTIQSTNSVIFYIYQYSWMIFLMIVPLYPEKLNIDYLKHEYYEDYQHVSHANADVLLLLHAHEA